MVEPQKIDITAIEEVAVGAGYTLTKISLGLTGKLATTDAGVTHLVVAGTLQRIELKNNTRKDGRAHVTGPITGFGDVIVMTVTKEQEPPAEAGPVVNDP